MMNPSDRVVSDYVGEHADRLVAILSDLVRIPSENTPPVGAEKDCQNYIAACLRELGLNALAYSLDEVRGLKEHPLFFPGRDYRDRPNVAARIQGTGGGRSLVLSGHIDTVPRGTLPWTRDPFGAEIEGDRLFGRGANDMKGGVATNLFVVEAIRKLGLKLRGDLVFESVVDEEFGGVNGTLAGRLHGFNGDAAVISEPSFLRICAGQRGGCVAHVTLKGSGGVLNDKRSKAGVVEQLMFLLSRLQKFADDRRRMAPMHELYEHTSDPVPVAITKVVSSPWGMREPITIPEECRVEIYWQTLPGEDDDAIQKEFCSWLESLPAADGSPFDQAPQVEFPIRRLPGSAISKAEPIIQELSACATAVVGEQPPVVGIEGPCDLFAFHQVSRTPAVLWGGRGGQIHGSDEYVELSSLVQAAEALLRFVCRWCGHA